MRRDLTGQKFGSLLVLECLGENLTPGKIVKRHGKLVELRFFGYKYRCLCDCGKEHIALNTDLERMDGKGTRTCGCSNEEKLVYMRSKRPPAKIEAGVKQVMFGYCEKWKKDPIRYEWRLTFEEFKELIFLPCIYCKRVGVSTWGKTRAKRGQIAINYNGIDRVDTERGYFPENVVTCCNNCNKGKGAHPIEEFNVWRQRIKENLPTIIERFTKMNSTTN